jgi:hypothetical protein
MKLYDWRIVGSVLVIPVVLIYLPKGNVPDYLGLTKSIEAGLFTRITISFISVFSFLVTVLLLGYGFLREKFRRLTLKEFLENRWIKLLISSFISVFLVDIFATIYLDSHEFSHNSLNIAYFSLISSVVYFVGFVPLALLAVASTDSLDLVGKYIAKFETKHFPEYRSHELLITGNELNPIVIVNGLSRSFAERDDFHSINSILFTTQTKIEELIGESKDRELIGRYLAGQRIIWDTIVHKAFQKKEFSVIERVYMMVSLYHHHFSEKEIPLLYLEEIRSFVNALMERLVDENVHTVVQDALMTIEKVIEFHYKKSVPKQEVLYELIYFFEKTEENHKKAYANPGKDRVRMDNNMQWNQICSDIPYIFSVAIRKAIDKKNRVIVDAVLHSIKHLIHASYISDMGEYQKAWIARMESGTFYYYQIEAIKANLIAKDIEIMGLDSFVLDKMIDSNSVAKKYLFISTGEFMIDLHELGKLNLASFNFMGSIGRHCANNYHLPGAKESFEFVLNMVNYFKTEFETELVKHSKNYLTLKDEVESFIKFHEMKPLMQTKLGEKDQKNENLDGVLIDRLKKLLGEFKEVPVNAKTKGINWE